MAVVKPWIKGIVVFDSRLKVPLDPSVHAQLHPVLFRLKDTVNAGELQLHVEKFNGLDGISASLEPFLGQKFLDLVSWPDKSEASTGASRCSRATPTLSKATSTRRSTRPGRRARARTSTRRAARRSRVRRAAAAEGVILSLQLPYAARMAPVSPIDRLNFLAAMSCQLSNSWRRGEHRDVSPART